MKQPRSSRGRWVAYQSNESRRQEIYIIPFSQTPSGPVGKRQVSAGGGSLARWRQDGKEIFYMGQDRRLMAAEVAVKQGTLEIGKVLPLFDTSDLREGSPSFDVSADGQHFLLRTFSEQKSSEPLTLFQNWAAVLKK